MTFAETIQKWQQLSRFLTTDEFALCYYERTRVPVHVHQSRFGILSIQSPVFCVPPVLINFLS